MAKRILFIVGTRPEAIKIAPLYYELKNNSNMEIMIGLTGQHNELLYQALNFFGIEPDFDLEVMSKNQSLNGLIAKVITGIDQMLIQIQPDFILVQGDTSTVFGASLAAFHHKIKVIHLEAGLRSFDKYSPFPEEINRQLTSVIADIHFTPTRQSALNLEYRGIKQGVHIVGNTVIDALFLGLKRIEETGTNDEITSYFSFLDFQKKIVLLTCHRRENFGKGLLNIVSAVKEVALTFSNELQFCFPVHPNPNIKDVVLEHLKDLPNVFLISPLSYPYLIWLMNKSYFILTDSGGIQEEAPSLKKPILVMRDKTERVEGVDEGNAVLLGNDRSQIVTHCERLMRDEHYYQSFFAKQNPYGDGTASAQINRILNENYGC